MTVFYDKEKIIEDLDMLSLLDNLNIPVKRMGKHISVLCPFHNDNHFGSAYLLCGMHRGRLAKGIYCQVCHEYTDAISLVQNILGLDYKNTLEYLANLNSFAENYILDTDYNYNHSQQKNNDCAEIETNNNNSTKKSVPKIKKMPFSQEELSFLGFFTDFSNDNYAGYDIKCSSKFKPSDDKFYIEHCYIRDNELNYEYLICEKNKNKYDLQTFFNEDFEAFCYLLQNKIDDKKEQLLSLLSLLQYSVNEDMILIKQEFNFMLNKVETLNRKLSELFIKHSAA